VAEGTLLRLSPEPGTALAVHSPVQVTLSLGPAPVAIPRLLGRTVAEAGAALAGAGLRVGATTEVFSPTTPGGSVVGTDPPAGSSLHRGELVTLRISNAVTVPGLRGRTVGTARTQLTELGLQAGVRQLVAFDGSLVVSQNVGGGPPGWAWATRVLTRVPAPTTVVITALP